MKLGNLGKAENPLTGKSFELLNPSTWIAGILGVVALIFMVSIGQRIAGDINARVPVLSTTINDPITHMSAPKPTTIIL